MRHKPLIIWDFDDVLFPLTESWFAHRGKQMQSQITSFTEIIENPPHTLMGITIEAYLESLDSFRISNEAQEILPHKDIQNWFAMFGSDYNNEILTARPLHTLDAAKEWVARHFPNYFQGFGFVPSPRPGVDISGYPASKRAFIEEVGLKPQYFIDDKAKTVADIAQIPGVKSILYPAPWNAARGLSTQPQQLMNG